ncbi:MAG: hypothetical protein ACI4C1_10400 [Lachnospiraceae bacterium]
MNKLKSMHHNLIFPCHVEFLQLTSNGTLKNCVNKRIKLIVIRGKSVQNEDGYQIDLNNIHIMIGNQELKIEQKLCSMNGINDYIFIDIENQRVIVRKHIQASEDSGYVILESPQYIELDWLSEYNLVTTQGDMEVQNCSNIFSQITIEYYAKGIIDGLPAVKNGLITVFDGWNNAGRNFEQDFLYPGSDLIGNAGFYNSKYGNENEHGYGRKGMHLNGNESMSDLIIQMRNDKITKNSALELDALGKLKDDGNGCYEIIPETDPERLPAYSYLYNHAYKPKGHLTVYAPDRFLLSESETETSVQIITRLCNPSDNYFCGIAYNVEYTMSNEVKAARNMAATPFDDLSLLIRNLYGTVYVYLNDQNVTIGPTFRGNWTGPDSQDFYLGFCRQGDINSSSRAMDVYAIYIYDRKITKDEVNANMRQAGQRFQFPFYQRKFPVLQDNGNCKTLQQALRLIGYRNATDEKLEILIQEIAELNIENKLYVEINSQEFHCRMLDLMREGKLLRPTSFENRRKKYTERSAEG